MYYKEIFHKPSACSSFLRLLLISYFYPASVITALDNGTFFDRGTLSAITCRMFEFYICTYGHLAGLLGFTLAGMRPMYWKYLAIVFHQASRFQRCSSSPDCKVSFFKFLLPVWMQVFMVLFVVPADPAVTQVFPVCFFVCPCIYVDCIKELPHNAVIPADFFEMLRSTPVFRVKPSDTIRIVRMAFR